MTVFGRYIDEEFREGVSGNTAFGMNRLNGKYNFHFGYVAPENAEVAAEAVIYGITNGYKNI